MIIYNNSKEKEKSTSMNMIFLAGMGVELQCSPVGRREGGGGALYQASYWTWAAAQSSILGWGGEHLTWLDCNR